MRYLKVLLIIFGVILFGSVAFYVYEFSYATKTNKSVAVETERPFQNTEPKQTPVTVVNFQDYTSADTRYNDKTLNIRGRLQSADVLDKVINGIAYNYVIGVLQEDGVLARIWLTPPEYNELKQNFSNTNILYKKIITFNISNGNVTVKSD